MLHTAASKLLANRASPLRQDMNGGIFSIVDAWCFRSIQYQNWNPGEPGDTHAATALTCNWART